MVHPFEPVFRPDSRILILGTFPSVQSREQLFYYGHPRNRFWRVLAAVLGEELPGTADEKKALLFRRRIALWDVVQNCDIVGSSDSSIRNVRPADLSRVLSASAVAAIYANGARARDLYNRYQQAATGMEIITLPSTSPANAAWSLERLTEAWRVIAG